MPYIDWSSLCTIDDGKYHLFNDGTSSFIIDNNANVVKEFDMFRDISRADYSQTYKIPKDKDKKIYYFKYKKDDKAYNLLLDYKFNIILDEDSKYPDDEYVHFEVKFYDDCFSFVKDMNFYVLDYDKNIIFKSDINNFKR